MNLLDACVTKILGPVYTQYGKYWVKVEADCWGRPTQTSLMFETEEEARCVGIGYHYLT